MRSPQAICRSASPPRLGYTNSDVILNLTARLAPRRCLPGLAPSPTSLVTLNDFFNGGGALPPAFLPVFGLTGGSLGNALSQLSGEAATGARQSAFQFGGQFLNLMLDPFVDGRGPAARAGRRSALRRRARRCRPRSR